MVKKVNREQRRLATVPAHMSAGSEMIEISIANVSRGGLMAKVSSPPAVGTRVEIFRRSLCIVGEVVWIAGRRFGIRADEPIDLEAMLATGLSPSKVSNDPGVVKKGWWHWRT